MRFLEKNIADEKMRKELLENEEYRFWDWWWMQYVGDDIWVILYQPRDKETYLSTKHKIYDNQKLFDSFQHFLNARYEF